MSEKVVPMIHVPDVRATVEWYQSIGFKVLDTYSDDGEGFSFGMVSFGKSEVMFNEGGRPSSADRREVDLYVYPDDVDGLYDSLKDRVEVVQELYDTFYGMREFIIRDCNRFWITFGQHSDSAVLMSGVREGNKEVVMAVLKRAKLKPENLTVALATVLTGPHQNSEIAKLLEESGAVPPATVDPKRLHSYAGKYKSPHGSEVNVTCQNDKLFVTWFAGQEPVGLVPLNETTFRAAVFDETTLTFKGEAGKMIGFELKLGGESMLHKRES